MVDGIVWMDGWWMRFNMSRMDGWMGGWDCLLCDFIKLDDGWWMWIGWRNWGSKPFCQFTTNCAAFWKRTWRICSFGTRSVRSCRSSRQIIRKNLRLSTKYRLYHPRKSQNPMVDDDFRYQHWYFSTKIFRCLKQSSAVLLQLSSVGNSARCYCVRGNRRTHSPALSKSLYQWTFRFSGGFWDLKSSILGGLYDILGGL